MKRSVWKGKYQLKRKKVFERDDLRLWLDTRETRAVPRVVLTLERRRPRSRTTWDTFWSGTVQIENWGATVETQAQPAKPK